MPTTQLELKLWEDLEEAAITPETADLVHLWQELEAVLASLSQEQKLPMAGKAIEQIASQIHCSQLGKRPTTMTVQQLMMRSQG